MPANAFLVNNNLVNIVEVDLNRLQYNFNYTAFDTATTTDINKSIVASYAVTSMLCCHGAKLRQLQLLLLLLLHYYYYYDYYYY